MSDTKHFFVSYNKADIRWAEWIAQKLEDNGYGVQIQAWDSRPGMNFIAWMQQASVDCDRTLAVLSPDYFTGKFSEMEWTAALYDGKLLTVRVADFQVPGLLGPIGYIDLVGTAEEETLDRLLKGIQAGRAKPDKPLPFPGHFAKASSLRFPGTLPAVWNVARRNPLFTGREELLDTLKTTLSSGHSAALTALAGLGGVGKSQLALEYAHRYQADYELVWWFAAEESTSVFSGFSALARELDLPEHDASEQIVVVQAVLRYLHQRRGWLLIFDNAEDPEAIAPFLPQGAGHLLLTSRNPNWTGIAKKLEVTTWPREEAVDYLLKTAGLDDRAGAGRLAHTLGDLPLALAQAAAYIAASPGMRSYYDYVALFNTQRAALWAAEEKPHGYDQTVGTTWTMAMKRVEDEAPAGTLLLRLCAFFAPENIPIGLLERLAGHASDLQADLLQNPIAWNSGLAALAKYSLVTRSDDGISVHRLVQTVTRDRMGKEEEARWREHALALLIDAWPGDDYRQWGDCEALLPHAQACAERVETGDAESEHFAKLAALMGYFLDARGLYGSAEPLYQRALLARERVLGLEHPSTLTSVNNLASLLESTGRYAEAEPLYQRALLARERVLGLEHPSTLTSVNNLASLLESTGRYAEAEPLYRRALLARERVLGQEHPDTLGSVNNFALLLNHTGRYAEAEPLYQRALLARERVLGQEHPSTLGSVNNLAGLLYVTGRYAEAELLYKRAAEGFRRTLGPEHPHTKQAEENLNAFLNTIREKKS